MAETDTSPVSAGSPEPPRGAFDLHLDEKARLKLPAAFQRYLDAIGDKDVFITTVDKKVARIYPVSLWRKNEELMKARPATQTKAVGFVTQQYGGDSDIDSSGRVTLPSQLRELLALSPKSKVWLVCENQAFNLYTDAMYQATAALCSASLEDDLEKLQDAGFI